MTKATEVSNQIIHVNPLILFMRLIALVERSKNTVYYFACELNPRPTSLFQDNFMRHPDKSDLMHVLLNFNSEITGKKRKRNEGMNGQCNSKVRKIRKIEESKDQQEDSSSNRDENKDPDEPIDHKNEKEIAGNGDKVDEEISKNYHHIVDGSAILIKVFLFGKTFSDTRFFNKKTIFSL